MNHDVFISYSSQNIEAAQAICHVLEQNGIRCWMAPRDIPPGADYGDVIEDAIKACTTVVVLFSEPASSSQYVKSEINVAFEEQKTIIPIRLDHTPLSGQNRLILNKTHWIDAYPDYKTKFNDLVEAIAHSLGKEVKLETERVSVSKKSKAHRKSVTAAVISTLAVIACFLVGPKMVKQFHYYTYDKQGLHVKIKGLSAQQENALSSMLDDMVLVDGGAFIMGNTADISDYLTEQDSLSRNPHEVELDNFYVSKFEVTQKQWRAFLSIEGKCVNDGDDTAMDMLSWEDASSFAGILSSITGLEFSLPTEAQWEFAAKGGDKSRHYLFSGNDDATEVGWTSFEKLTSAHAVGGKRYNELGLYDMTGNVAEWCKDYYGPYTCGKEINPQGPEKGSNRVLRGGDFRIDNLYDMKTTTRYFDSPFTNRRGAGLRLVINIKQ